MVLTEEQRKQVEANRQAALAKRKAFLESQQQQQQQQHGGVERERDPWHLFKCQKLCHQNHILKQPLSPPNPNPNPNPNSNHKFLARLEICSPDSFSITPLPIHSHPFPSPETCFSTLNYILSNDRTSRRLIGAGERRNGLYFFRGIPEANVFTVEKMD